MAKGGCTVLHNYLLPKGLFQQRLEGMLGIWRGGRRSCPDCTTHSLCSLPCRVVSRSVTLPLGYVFKPVESLLVHCPKSLVDLPVVDGLLVPPVRRRPWPGRPLLRQQTTLSPPVLLVWTSFSGTNDMMWSDVVYME